MYRHCFNLIAVFIVFVSLFCGKEVMAQATPVPPPDPPVHLFEPWFKWGVPTASLEISASAENKSVETTEVVRNAPPGYGPGGFELIRTTRITTGPTWAPACQAPCAPCAPVCQPACIPQVCLCITCWDSCGRWFKTNDGTIWDVTSGPVPSCYQRKLVGRQCGVAYDCGCGCAGTRGWRFYTAHPGNPWLTARRR